MTKPALILMIALLVQSCVQTNKKEKPGSKNVSDTAIISKQTGIDSITHENEVEVYDYDTTLKNGYFLKFVVDDSLMYLNLVKDSLIRELSSCSKGLPMQNLGYKAADFDDYFVLEHSFGGGNPHYIELIEKKMVSMY